MKYPQANVFEIFHTFCKVINIKYNLNLCLTNIFLYYGI